MNVLFTLRLRMIKKTEQNKTLNADELEILERLYRSEGNAVKFCVNDCTFGRERFVVALDNLIRKDLIDSILRHSPIHHGLIGSTFNDAVKDDNTKVEIIKTNIGEQYIQANDDSMRKSLSDIEKQAKKDPSLAKDLLEAALRVNPK